MERVAENEKGSASLFLMANTLSSSDLILLNNRSRYSFLFPTSDMLSEIFY